MNKITFITPIHEITDEQFDTFFKRAVESLSVQENKFYDYIIIYANIVSEAHKAKLVEFKNQFPSVRLVEKTSDLDYCSMVNTAAAYVNTPYFSVLEFDDYVISKQWTNLIHIYADSYPDVSLFLSIVRQTNEKDEVIGITNEAFWALEDVTALQEEQLDFNNVGFITLERALKKHKFDLTGAIIETDKFIEVGGLKSSIKLFFNQEFVFRMLHNGYTTFVIPKIMISHTNFREGSYLKQFENINSNELNFYKALAKKEYYFTEDRNITYQEESNI